MLKIEAARARAVEDYEHVAKELAEERKEKSTILNKKTMLEQELGAELVRVSQLESEVACLKEQMAALLQQQPGQQLPSAPTLAPQQQQPAYQQQQPAHQQQQQVQSTAILPSAGYAAAAPTGTITLNYWTGWHDAFIHFKADKRGWTDVPGMKLARGEENNVRTVTINANSLEFVMTNNRGEWDSPGRYSDSPSNYLIQSPGVYKLRSGRLERLS